MSTFACCHKGCGASVCFTPEIEARLRRTHETWTCPFGHSQAFVTKTDDEITIESLTKVIDRYRRQSAEVEELFGTCPACGWRTRSGIANRWLYLLRHFAKAHGVEFDGNHPVFAMYERRKELAS